MSQKNFFRLAVIFLFAGLTISTAQTMGGSFVVVTPQGEFADNYSEPGFGFQLQGTYPTPGRGNPFAIGLSVGYNIFQTTSERRPFSQLSPDVTVEVDRSHNLANFYLLLMLSPLTGDVRPYIEGLGGGSYLFTETSIESRHTDEEIASDTNFDDFAWSYGGGGGILIRVARGLGDVNELFIDLKVRYLKGEEAKYLTKDDIEISNGKVYYYPRTSRTDVISYNIGVQAFF